MNPLTRLAAAALLATGLVQPALAERENPAELSFGIIATESSSAQREKWGPFLAALGAVQFAAGDIDEAARR